MFYLIGVGLGEKSISADALEILHDCDFIYLEGYTVNFPYEKNLLEKKLNVKITTLNRADVEDESILKNAVKKNIALLVYGDSLSATTHIQLVLSCKKQGIPFKIFHNASILTAIAETGLSLYKFGKTASMPSWKEHTNMPTSFVNYIKENLSIKAHTLLLVDINLMFSDAIKQLKNSIKKENFKLSEKIVIVSKAGTEKQKIFYDSIENLENKKIEMPFCFVFPSELHFFEEECLNAFKEK